MSELVAAHYTKKLPIAKDKTGNFYIIRPIAVPPWVFNPDNIDILDFIGRVSYINKSAIVFISKMFLIVGFFMRRLERDHYNGWC